MLVRLFTMLSFLGVASVCSAQDLHFSQFYLNPLHLNPARTGAFQGDMRASGLYRSQWATVPVSYQTFAAAADLKVWERGANLISGGILVQHDKAGDAGLRWTQLGLSGSVAHALTGQQALSLGFGLAVAQRAFDISGLTFKNQWSAGDFMFDPTLPSKENFNQSSGFKTSMSVGLNWRFVRAGSRTEADAGIGAFHLNRPNVGFDKGTGESLPLRLAILANTAVEVNEFLDLVVFAELQQMGKAHELTAGGGSRLWLSPGKSAIQLSVATRLGDALIPALQYRFGAWTVGLSYDVNISDFDRATQKQGGFELAVVYQSRPVPPVKAFKSCPVF